MKTMLQYVKNNLQRTLGNKERLKNYSKERDVHIAIFILQTFHGRNHNLLKN